MAKPSPRPADVLAAALRAHMPRVASAADRVRDFATDPVGFAREILGIRLWKRQRELLEAIRDNGFVAAVSGHKIGKSTAWAVAGLWFYCSFPKSRVIITATTERQVEGIIWREVRWLAKQAERRGFKLPGVDDIHLTARGGLHDPELFSEIFGFTAREVEAVAGISAPHMLWLVDEASGIPDRIFEAIFGNMMGGAKIALISNPTKTTGEFARAFGKGSSYKTFEISSRETPNCTGDEEPIPGLADPEFIAKMAEQWGENSPQFRVRVLGQFVVEEEGKIFPLSFIEEACARWKENLEAKLTGTLVISLDPAGDKGEGDYSCFGVRRGNRLIELTATRGLDDGGHVTWLRGLVKKHAVADDQPVIVFDRDGHIGYKLIKVIKGAFPECRVVAVRGTMPGRLPQHFGNTRDELFANLSDRARVGELELPEDRMLVEEMGALSWTVNVRGKSKATEKKDIRKAIGRSPDRLDAVCLAFWWRDTGPTYVEPRAERSDADRDWAAMTAESDVHDDPFQY